MTPADLQADQTEQVAVAIPAVLMEWAFIEDGVEIPAGAKLGQHKLDTPEAEEFAALHLIRNDLRFAIDCFAEADKIGVPDATHTLSKALVFSATVAYARSFGTGARLVALRQDDLKQSCAGFSLEAHDYIVALRSKHVAHSVNSFERCEAFGVVVAAPEEEWREGNAVGVALQFDIGLTRPMLVGLLEHMRRVHAWVVDQITDRRRGLYEAFKTQFTPGTPAQAVAFVALPQLDAVRKKRK
jgi:hypothetical protein